MNGYLLASAIIVVLTALAHTVLGELWIIGKLETQRLPPLFGSRGMTRRTLRFAWHVTSVFGLGIAAILYYYAGIDPLATEQTFVLRILALTLFVSFVISLVGARGRHPSWLAFLAASLLTWFA